MINLKMERKERMKMPKSIINPDGKISLRDAYRDYRRLVEVRAEASENGDMIIEGTPVIFGQRYKLFRWGETDIYEVIEREAFNETDMADVPLKYNHGDSKGTPARTTCKGEQGKLTLSLYDDRLEMRANLLPTSGGKDLFLEVKSGTVSQMSWAFTEEPNTTKIVEEKDKKEITFYVKKVARMFDVSAVDFGANPETSIYARRHSDLDERAAILDEEKRNRLIQQIELKTKF